VEPIYLVAFGGIDQPSRFARSFSNLKRAAICTHVSTVPSHTGKPPDCNHFRTPSGLPDRRSKSPNRSAMPFRQCWRPGLPTVFLHSLRAKRKDMADKFSPQKRSQIMANVKGRNTSPERLVKSCLRRLHCRFRSNVRTVPGTPDIVLLGRNKAIFVHGCFWHGHRRCNRSKRPKTNQTFWNKKIDGNIQRDRRVQRALARLGWDALIIWECETRQTERLLATLETFINAE